ncbi:MAG TPA: four helix bundle protein [Phycisphaerae bacterium]|jgi:four helix bundle protein|nr:four helix bundle protein [Phycisphaerae bacterium]HOB74376.1 four helix bundle protein [Phycisphaerae bacterium]HOJ54505.1 four helix bundle protein [Phycisphaerae bacterium]HOL26534.1 four helix bundle protein [Phycisphaerae bacterium]HPP20933.1 four helix bundle protein [Phycisphaerae bacterium]
MAAARKGADAPARTRTIKRHTDLEVYQLAFRAAMQVFEVSKRFPVEERYSLTDQIRRCSRSVCTNLAEAWRKRRYPAAFVSKLSDSEGEAAETQVWLQFSVACAYVGKDTARELYRAYNAIVGKIVHMVNHPKDWVIGC